MNIKNIEIGRLAKMHITGAMQLSTAERWNQSEADWQKLIDAYPDRCLVALYQNTVVGTVIATDYGGRVAWIGMMLISREFRGMGIAKFLLQTILKQLADVPSIKLEATAAGLPLYTKLGFIEELTVHRMVASKIIGHRIDTNRKGRAKQSTKNDIFRAFELDRSIFGADRSQIVDLFISNQAWHLESNGEISGFLLTRPGIDYLQLGPLSAKTPQDAKILISEALVQNLEKLIVVDILADKSSLKEFLVSLGFEAQRSFKRMYLKNNSFSGTLRHQFLIAGPELG